MPKKNNHEAWRVTAGVTALFFILGLFNFLTAATVSGTELFHSGGVGYCEGCHVMHPGGPGEPRGGPGYTRGSDPSSTCLNCHAMKGQPYQVLSTDGSVFSPGGDFFWITESGTVTITNPDGSKTSAAYNPFNKGHNVVAIDYGLTNNPVMEFPPGNTSCDSNSPGFTVTSDDLSCINCHDPHGRLPDNTYGGNGGVSLPPISQSGSYGGTAPSGSNQGKYRLLNRTDWNNVRTGAPLWDHGDPVAAADPDPKYHFSETAGNRHHVDYGSGMSEWCSNCHCDFLNNGNTSSAHRHPSGARALLTKVAGTYNSYIRTGFFKGSETDSWLSLVPFERGTNDVTQLNGERTDGPSTGKENVMCLTCHRAHASAFDHDTRWDTYATFLNESSPGPIYNVGQNLTKPYVANAPYYGRNINVVFGPNQRSLCNKCHAED